MDWGCSDQIWSSWSPRSTLVFLWLWIQKVKGQGLESRRTCIAFSECLIITLCTKLSAMYCNRSCLWVCVFVVCLWVCYNNNSKLCVSILTKLGLQVMVVTISSWFNFWPSRTPGKGVCGGAKFLASPARSVCISSERCFYSCYLQVTFLRDHFTGPFVYLLQFVFWKFVD